MSKSHFAQYVSPNIIIVPTVSFENEQQVKPIATCTNRDNIDPSPPSSNCANQIGVVMNTKPTKSTSTADCFITQDTNATEASLNNMSNIKELPSSILYKSRNNLVDLTGFNILKRDIPSSLTKLKDSKRIEFTNMDTAKIIDEKEHCEYPDSNTSNTGSEKEHCNYSDSDTFNKDISKKESSNIIKPMNSHCKENTEDHVNSESKQNTTDKDLMKKYFRRLWKRNIEKLIDKSPKDKHQLKLNRTRHSSKDSHSESSKNKANLQSESKNSTIKATSDKIVDGSKKYHNVESRFIAKYTRKSKSEAKENSTVSKRDREFSLSPVSIRRYRDYQRFIRHNDDHENKYDTANRNKTENSHKRIRMKSCEPITNKPDIKKQVAEPLKSSVKREQHSKVNTNQNNKERINLIKSVVQVNNCSQSKFINGGYDLRSRLSRKRTRSECFEESQQTVESKVNQENLVTTPKQEAKVDSIKSATLASNVNKPKTKKCKKIKLIINIECPYSSDSDSDQNFDEYCSSPQDLSFLDDFNVDEIVDSLNLSPSQVESNKITTTGNTKSKLDIKRNENDTKSKYNEVTKAEGSPVNNINMQAIKINEEETSHKGEVIEINSDPEDADLNINIGSITNNNKEQIMKINSKINKKIDQEANNITDLTGISDEENAQEAAMDLCDDSDDGDIEIIDFTDDNKHKAAKHSLLAGNVQHSKSNKGEPNVDRVFELLTRSNRPSFKPTVKSETITKYSVNTPNISGGQETKVHICEQEDTTKTTVENYSEIKVKEKEVSDITENIHLQKTVDPIESSLKTMDGHIKQNNTDISKDTIEQLKSSDKYIKVENKVDAQVSENTVEASLETNFNNIDHNANMEINIEVFNGPDRKVKEENLYLENSGDVIKQEAGITANIEQPNLFDQSIKIEPEYSQTSVGLLLETTDNNIEQNNNIKIEDIPLKTEENMLEKKDGNKIDIANNKDSTNTNAKSNVEDNQHKLLESVKNDTRKLIPINSIDDDSSKIIDIKITNNKDSKPDESAGIASNSNANQKQNDSIENNDLKEGKHESKSIKEVKSEVNTPFDKSYKAAFEKRMIYYLDRKYTATSVIHRGRYSTIYKCTNVKEETYAVKVMNSSCNPKAKFIEKILFQMQKYRSRKDSCLMYLMNIFDALGRTCLLTEYYPKNLEQALAQNVTGFHIDLVQILSRQLVDAVNALTTYNIIHSDIHPGHILLNNKLDRLKLSGFERSNYSKYIKINPSTGIPNYRAPEIIMGFAEDHKIDVWSTALIMFEMTTNKRLFQGHYNNEILYQQLSTFGNLDWSMVEQGRYRSIHFTGRLFMRQLGAHRVFIHNFEKKKELPKLLFTSYHRVWAPNKSRWQKTKDLDKLERLHVLLEQMLALDPRRRLPIQFVGASEFLHS